MAKAPDYGSYIPDANDPVYVTQARAAQLAKEQPLYASGQGTPIFNNPGGIDGYVQFNSASSFGGDVGFTYNKTTRSVNILGNLNVGGYLNSKFYTNFANLRISGGNAGEVIFTDGDGNLSWGNLENYLTDETYVAERLVIFQQGNVNFTGPNVSLGNVSNIYISGGSPNYILSTDGNGNLSWIEETGGGTDSFRIHKGTTSVSIDDIDGNINLVVNEEYEWFFNTDGELLAGGAFVTPIGDIGNAAGYTFATDRDTGMYSDTDGHLKFKTNDRLVAFYTDNDVHLYTKSSDYITTYDWHLDRTGNLTLPVDGAINYSNGVSILDGLGGVSISDFGEGFSLTASNKIVTNKLYSTNQTQPTQHYRLEVDTNGVVILPDQSIINGSYIRSVPTSYAGLASGPDQERNEDSWMWVDSSGAHIATMYSSDQHEWNFNNDGTTELPGTVIFPAVSDGSSSPYQFQILPAQNTEVTTTSPTVIFTGSSDLVETMKATIQVQDYYGTDVSDVTTYHSQICEILVVRKRVYDSNADTTTYTAEAMVYGVIHTSTTPMATFDARWNSTDNVIELTTVIDSEYTSGLSVKVIATESVNLAD